MHKRQQQAAYTRQQLIDTTYKLIGEQGYEALSANTLVKAAGVTKGALYHHFDSIEDVAYAALESSLYKHFAAIDFTREEHPIPDTIEQYFDQFEQALFTDTFSNPTATKALFSFIRVGMFNQRYSQLLEKMLEEGCQKFTADIAHYCGHLPEQQLASTGRLIDAMIGGLGVHWFTFEKHQRTREDWRRFRQMVISSLKQAVDVTLN